MSIDEMHIRPLDVQLKWLNITSERFFFAQNNVKGQVLVQMLGMTPDNYSEVIQSVRNTIVEIVNRFQPEYLWLADYVANKMVNMVELYFSRSGTQASHSGE